MLSVMETKPSAYKRQRRREKSKEAARCRRHKETDTFQDICDAIPIPHDIVSQLDRSSTMRVVNCFIKLRHSMTGSNPKPAEIESVKQEADCWNRIQSDDCVNALNGFVFVLSSDFDLLYISENVKEYLGLSNLDLVGQSLLMFTHEGDRDEIRNVFSKSNQETCGQRKSFIVRIKSTLTVSGKNINLKSATYKVIRCSGVVNKNVEDASHCFVAHAEVIPHPSNIEHFMDSSTFLTQQTPDMKLTYCDERISVLLGYDEDDLLGKSFYDYCHVLDIKHIEESFKKLYKVGQIETDFYRFLSKFGGYHWVVTQATVISNPRNMTPECVVCIHYVTSNCVEPTNLLSVNQCQNALALPVTPPQCDMTKEILEEIEPFFIEGENVEEGSDKRKPIPIMGSDCSIVMPTFSEMDDTEEVSMASMYYNSPSIGDPCLFIPQQNDETFEDLFRDVVLENTKKNHQVIPPISNQTNESFNVDQIVEMSNTKCGPFQSPNQSCMNSPQSYTGSSSSLYDNPMSYNNNSSYNSPQRYNQLTPQSCGTTSPQPYSPMSGIISPPLSNYGSPCNSPYPSNNYNPATVNQPNPLTHQPLPLQQPIYQRVEVPSSFYDQHAKDLLRGRIDDPSMVGRKRTLNKSPLEGAFADNKKCCYGNDRARNYLRIPGDSRRNDYGYEFNISDLFQPEMNISNARGLTKNLANPNFLPELSLHDCQVSAPCSSVNPSGLPRGVDCVHALDDPSSLPL